MKMFSVQSIFPPDAVAFTERWQAAFMRLPTPVVIFAHTGQIIAVNRCFAELTGYEVTDVPDVRALALKVRRLAPDEVDEVVRTTSAQFEAPAAREREMTVYSRAGRRMVWLVNSTGQIAIPGGARVLVTMAVDITAQREAEEQAARREREIESLYDWAPVGLAFLDRDLRFVRINDALAEMNGIPAHDHIGRFVFDIVPDLREQAEPIMRSVIATGRAVRDIPFSGKTAREPGVLRDWIEHFNPVKSANGEILGVSVVCEEVTQRRNSERRIEALIEELRRTVGLFQISLKAANVTSFALDRQRRFIWASEGPWGVPARDLLDHRDEEVLPEQRWRVAVPIKEKVLAEGGQAVYEVAVEIDGAARVLQVCIEAMRDENGAVAGIVGASIDVTERHAHEAHIESLMRELAHRSKNLLSVIQGLARHSARQAGTLEAFLPSFVKRLDGLARSQDLLTKQNWQGVELHDLIRSQLAHFGDLDGARLQMDGPPCELNSRAVQNLGMALHELSTNAVKYGSLSTPAGRVEISWRFVKGAEPQFVITWAERDGPPVAPPKAHGFGHIVMRDLAARALMGKVSLDFGKEGLRWQLSAPTSAIVQLSSASGSRSERERSPSLVVQENRI